MNSLQGRIAALAAAAALLLTLGACNRPDQRTAARRLEGSSSTAANAGAPTTASAEDPARGETDRAHAESTRAMGAAGAKVDDATITAKVNASLVKDKDLSAIRIDVDTQDGVVTLSGLAPSASAKERASELAHRVPGVQTVNNQLTIKSS